LFYIHPPLYSSLGSMKMKMVEWGTVTHYKFNDLFITHYNLNDLFVIYYCSFVTRAPARLHF
jgi:hypothetical protein